MKELRIKSNILNIIKNPDVEEYYVTVTEVCSVIGLTMKQRDRHVANIQKDPLLKQHSKLLSLRIGIQTRKTLCIEIKILSVWLSSINRNSLSKDQYEIVVELLNWCLSTDFLMYKIPTKLYEWEGELRDDIYESGYFNAYKVISKEVSHDYGRVDLLAKDSRDKLIGIELKKDKNYNDVITQCDNHKKGLEKKFGGEVKIIICTLDEDTDFLKRAKSRGYDVYTYKRNLKLNKVS